MSLDANKTLARRWFDSSTYRETLEKVVRHGDPGKSREEFFASLISEVFSRTVSSISRTGTEIPAVSSGTTLQ